MPDPSPTVDSPTEHNSAAHYLPIKMPPAWTAPKLFSTPKSLSTLPILQQLFQPRLECNRIPETRMLAIEILEVKQVRKDGCLSDKLKQRLQQMLLKP